MLTLKEATTLLGAAGVRDVRMTRSYKRKGYRDVLIEGFIHLGDGPRNHAVRKARAHEVLDPLAAQIMLEGTVERAWSNWSENNIKVELFCKVQLPEPL